MEKNDFYIGWMPEAPARYSRFVKRVVLFLSIIIIITGIAIALTQKKFSSAVFEFGKLTEITGVYMPVPVPSITVESSKDIFGRKSYLTIPLVGYGKHGAEGVIASVENQLQQSVSGKTVVLKGTLLFSDGKTLLQIDAADGPLIRIASDMMPIPAKEDLGQVSVKGEIVDPKCYFGVMKPGEGKPHKDCAIRCILGGIPPVLRVPDGKGGNIYYLLAGGDQSRMAEIVQQYVAEPVEVTANAVRYGDWVVLSPEKDRIKRISGREMFMTHRDMVACLK